MCFRFFLINGKNAEAFKEYIFPIIYWLTLHYTKLFTQIA